MWRLTIFLVGTGLVIDLWFYGWELLRINHKEEDIFLSHKISGLISLPFYMRSYEEKNKLLRYCLESSIRWPKTLRHWSTFFRAKITVKESPSSITWESPNSQPKLRVLLIFVGCGISIYNEIPYSLACLYRVILLLYPHFFCLFKNIIIYNISLLNFD
jgi:hypothetical protein